MPAFQGRILGWKPATKDSAPVQIPRETSRPFTFQYSNPDIANHSRSSSQSFEASSPASSTTSSFKASPSRERESKPSKKNDPTWVARPRNPFIIFRCDFSREHAKDSETGAKRGAGASSDKTLSKRAGDAWHQLPDEEKNRYKILAEREKNEHARANPNYRFKPTKRTGDLRRVRTTGSLPLSRRTLKTPTSLSPTRVPVDQASVPGSPYLPSSYPSSPSPATPTRTVVSSVKAQHRRSASMPVVQGHPFILPLSDIPKPLRPDIKRSKSITEGWMQDEGQTPHGLKRPPLFHSLSSCGSSDPYSRLSPSNHTLTYSHSMNGFPPTHVSPLSAIASSLANWNGEATPPISSPAMISPSTSYSSPNLTDGDDYQLQYPEEYVDEGAPAIVSHHVYSRGNPMWGGDILDQPYHPLFDVNQPLAVDSPLRSFEELEAAHAAAIRDYHLGISNQQITADSGLSPFDVYLDLPVFTQDDINAPTFGSF